MSDAGAAIGVSGAGACPCCSGSPYAACCAPYVDDGRPAPTAEALMRSRYTAYALRRIDHLFRTWHPRTRPADLVPDPSLEWTGLRVLDVVDGGPGDASGVVEFSAAWRTGDLHERSTFTRRGGRWVYLEREA